MSYQFSEEFALQQVREDQLADYRNHFIFPVVKDRPALYFTGNSLGLQAVKTKQYLLNELEDWARYGVEGDVYKRQLMA